MHLDDAATIRVLSGNDPATGRIIDVDELVALSEGTYESPAIYGIAPHQPIAMYVTIIDGAGRQRQRGLSAVTRIASRRPALRNLGGWISKARGS